MKRRTPKLPGYSISQFAAAVDASPMIIRAAVRNGAIKMLPFGRHQRIPPRELTKFLEIWGNNLDAAAEPPAEIVPGWPSWAC